MSFEHVAVQENQLPAPRLPSNRRAYVRYQCAPATAGRVVLEGQEWQRAWVLDLCVSGAGLLLGKTLEVGLEVVVHLITAAQQKVLEVPARICHATRQTDGDWFIGCEFINKLTDELLDALLQ